MITFFLLTVCSLLRLGIAAVFGPQSAQISSHVQSICDTMEIPHLETRWDYKLRRDSCLVNLYPHPTVLSKVTYNNIIIVIIIICPGNAYLYTNALDKARGLLPLFLRFTIIYTFGFTRFTGLLGFGKKMGMEVVHDNIREQ